MTLGILAASAALIAALCAAAVCVLAIRHRREGDRYRREVELERDGARAAAEDAIADRAATERDRGRLEARCEQLRDRVVELDAELEPYRRSPLEGRTVVVNTPKPDDQAFRGVVIRELEPRGVILAGAVVLDRVEVRGGGYEVSEVPAGEVVVPHYAWLQLLNPTQED